MSIISLRRPMSAALPAFRALAACSFLFCSVPGAAALSPEEMNAWFCGGPKTVPAASSGAAGAPAAGGARKDGGEDVLSVLKPEGTKRVFVVGESPAGLLGPGENAPLKTVLEAVFPDGRLELVNCVARDHGQPGIAGTFEKVLGYEPDMVVVLGGGGAPGTVPAAQEEELRGMARLARGKNVPVVLCTLPANMCGYAPSGELPFEQAWLLRGMALLEKKDFAGALTLFELNLKRRPREPFSLFYAGRALERLGRAKDAAAYYSDAIKYDPAPDKCPAERNEIIRRAAAEEGACLADLDRAFSGIAADGSRWSREHVVFVSSVIGGAARGCASPAGNAAGAMPVPAAPPGRGEYRDFRAVLSYAVTYLPAGAFCDAPAGERAVVMVERLYSMDPARLERLLFSPAELKKELQGGLLGNALNKNLPFWRPNLLYSAAEMFRRNGNAALARRCVDLALRLKADCPALSLARWRIRRAAGDVAGSEKDLVKAASGLRTRAFLTYLDAALDLAPGPLPASAAPGTSTEKNAARDGGVSKKMSDEAVDLITKGDPAGARALLLEAVAKDRDNFEARMNLCFLALKADDVPMGEEHCNEAVFLAVAPPKHAVLSKDRLLSAFYSRALFYLATGNNAEACRDLRRASAEAPAGWPPAAETRERAEKACAAGK